jgi:mRNA interferase RelE/StbE
MGYEIYFENTFLKNVKKIPLTERNIIFSKIDFLMDNPDHPSLRTEKLFKGTKNEIRSSSVSMGVRLLWRLKGNIIYIKDVGGHDIYK